MEKLLNDEEYDHFTVSENQALINRSKNNYIEENPKKWLNDKEYDCCSMNNSKHHYTAITKPNVLLAKFLSNHDGEGFCLNCFCNFQTENNLSKNVHNTKCNYCMKYKDCKNCGEYANDSFEWCEICGDCKKLSNYCKECNKYMKTVNVILNAWK